MKNALVLLAFCLLISTACKKIDRDVFFKLGSGQEYSIGDIDLYDTSTHILYFKKNQDYFENMFENSFAFMNNGEIIYQGSFNPGYSSSMPNGPFILSPSMYGTYALKIDYWTNPNYPDVRDHPTLINILNQNNLLHSGLKISENSIHIEGSQLTFKFTVSNPEKTGTNLFHYFTNGLYIRDLSHNEVFSSNIQSQTPDPWNSWKIDWLSELKSGDSKEFTIIYTIENPLGSGEYKTSFEFPGLGIGGMISKDQLFQGNSRIWLGRISTKKSLTIP
jgi:hypothetical protein